MRVGVTGHQSIPPKIVAFIEAGIKQALRDNAADLVGVSSLAAGADQLFSAREEYRELLVLAAVIEQLDHNSPSEEAFLDAGQHVVDRSDRLIAVWDGDDAQGKGGTGDVVRYARERGIEVIVVWPEGVKR